MVPDHEVYAEIAHPGVLLLWLFQLLLPEEIILRGYGHSDCGGAFVDYLYLSRAALIYIYIYRGKGLRVEMATCMYMYNM